MGVIGEEAGGMLHNCAWESVPHTPHAVWVKKSSEEQACQVIAVITYR